MTCPNPSLPISEDINFKRLSNFRHQLRHFLKFSEEICQNSGLTSLQYQLLLEGMSASDNEWITLEELSEKFPSNPPIVKTLIECCENLELIKRYIRKNDKGKVAIQLTSKGLELIRHLALLHQQELPLLQNTFPLPSTAKFCTSPVCWKGSD